MSWSPLLAILIGLLAFARFGGRMRGWARTAWRGSHPMDEETGLYLLDHEEQDFH